MRLLFALLLTAALALAAAPRAQAVTMNYGAEVSAEPAATPVQVEALDIEVDDSRLVFGSYYGGDVSDTQGRNRIASEPRQ